jgi:hypothetical protein
VKEAEREMMDAISNLVVSERPGNEELHGVVEELVKLRACVTCGKRDARLGCKLCRGVRYCDKRCQQKDWARGTEPHPPHRETCSRVVNGIMPPWYFALFREQAAMEREAMEREVSN